MNNIAIYPLQSNVLRGILILTAASTMVGKEGYLAVLGSTGLTPVAAATDLANYLVLDGAASEATVVPLSPDQQVRVRLNGTCSKGDIVVLATGGDVGKVTKLAAQTGKLFSPGIAEEDGADEQMLLIRPLPRYLTGAGGAIAFAGAAPAATAATSTTPFGFAQAQADALLLNVNNMRAALIAHGIMAANA